MKTSTTSKQQVPSAVRPGAGPWVGVAPNGSVIPAPYLLGAPIAPADLAGARPGFAGAPANFAGPVAVGPRRRRADVAVFGVAALVGVLAIVAPFLVVWRYGFNNGLFDARTVVNGWGSVSAHPASFATNHSHDTDYGLPMILAAAFLLAGTAVYLITRRAMAAVLPTSVGASLAAGTALLLALDRGGRDSAISGSDSWAVGSGFWLIVMTGGLGVLVASAAAVLVTLDLRAAAPAHPSEGFGPTAFPSGPADPARFAPQDPAWAAAPHPTWTEPANPTWAAAPHSAWTQPPTDQAGFTPPWAP